MAKEDQRTGYGTVVKIIRTELEGITIKDRSVFLGSSPAYYNYEFNKIIKNNTVTSTSMDLTNPEIASVKSTYDVRIFDRELVIFYYF